MNDAQVSILAIVLILSLSLVASVTVVVAMDTVRRRRSHKQLTEDSLRHAQRLNAPKFESVASLFNCQLPDSVLRLYRSKEELNREDFEIVRPKGEDPIYVAYYCPCDPEAAKDTYPDCKHLLTIARDGCDLSYMIDPQKTDPPVVAFDDDTGQFTIVAEALTSFLEWPRRSCSEACS